MTDYEKKYNEALERARKAYQDIKPENTAVKTMLEEAFPELCKSEDERIRKELIEQVEKSKHHPADKERWIAWLEKQKDNNDSDKIAAAYQLGRADERKQKEQKPVEWKDYKDKVNIPYCSSEPEWSEEDERRYLSCLHRLGTGDPSQPETVNSKWFKEHVHSCPSWKPSEEHLSALLAVFNDPDNIGSQTCQLALTDLYEQLMKL